MRPQPAFTHENYPFHTHGGGDSRWTGSEEMEKNGLHWVGSLMSVSLSSEDKLTLIVFHCNFRITAQLLSWTRDADSGRFGTQQYASFDWNDLWAIAPWMQEIITKKVTGAGLGN
jgi:hypothetical protein